VLLGSADNIKYVTLKIEQHFRMKQITHITTEDGAGLAPAEGFA
jgi:hypothetical protein